MTRFRRYGVGVREQPPAAHLGADDEHSFGEIAFLQQTADHLPNPSDTDVYFVNAERSLVAPLTTNPASSSATSSGSTRHRR